MAPFFPIYALKHGTQRYEIGYIFAALPLGSFLASLPSAYLVSLWGHACMINVGLIVLASSTWLFGQCLSVNAWICFRFLQGVGSTFTCTGVTVALGEEFDGPDEFQWVNGLQEASAAVAFTIGPVVGGVLYSIGGFSLPFTFSALVHLAFVALSLFFGARRSQVSLAAGDDGLTGSPSEENLLSLQDSRELSVRLRDVLDRNTILLGGAVFLMTFMWAAIEPNLPSFLIRRLGDVDSWTLGMIISAPSIPSGLAALFCRNLRRWFSPAMLIVLGLSSSGVICIVLGCLDTPKGVGIEGGTTFDWVVIVSLLLLLGAVCSIGWTPAFPEMVAMASNKVSSNHPTLSAVAIIMPLVTGIFNFASSSGETVGPLEGSALCDLLNFKWMMSIMGGSFILWALVIYIAVDIPKQGIFTFLSPKKPLEPLPDLTDRLKELGVFDEYLKWSNDYKKWRKGGNRGAHGDIGRSMHRFPSHQA